MAKSVLLVDMKKEEMMNMRRLSKVEENKKDFKWPLLVALPSEMKEEIIHNLSNLKGSEYLNIFIKHDTTRCYMESIYAKKSTIIIKSDQF